MINIQHITLNDMTILAKLCMSTGTKISLAEKKICPDGLTVSAVKRNEPTAVAQGVYKMADIHVSTVSQHSPKKQN